MNILILDAYPKKSYRISKDVNGGYGIAHNYGTTLFSKLLRLYVKYSIDFPPLYVAQVCGELLIIYCLLYYFYFLLNAREIVIY